MSNVPSMARTKKLERKYVEHLAAILRPIVRDEFEGNAAAFARHIRVSQPTIQAILKAGADRGVGITVLMALREYLGRSIDDIIGLPPLKAKSIPVDELGDAVRSAVRSELEERFPRASSTPPPPSAPARSKRKRPSA